MPQPISRSLRRLILAGLMLLGCHGRADNLSSAFVRGGLPYYDQSGYVYVMGLSATVGEIEVRNSEGNGIDGFPGNENAALGPQASPFGGQYGFVNVVDYSGSNDPTDNFFHGTYVAGIMASEYRSVTDGVTSAPFLGVAPLATYYGAVFAGNSDKTGFVSLNNSLNYTLVQQGASVVNNSWGSEVGSPDQLDGNSVDSLLMDEYAGYAGKTGGTTGRYLDKLIVMAAGNSGTSGGLLGQPADAYNVLTVGALDAIDPNATWIFDPNRGPANRVAPYSSWAPLANGRAGVDVVAPGTNIWSTLATVITGTNTSVGGVASGTSFAAPHATGVAALLYGLGNSGYPTGIVSAKGTFLATDHKLMKAILMNSADKIPGKDALGNAQAQWEPGLVVSTTDAVPNAIVPINYAVGAGSVNANSAFLEYTEQGNTFWDVNTLAATGTDIYYTFGIGKFATADPTQLLSGLTATLVWDRHVDLTLDTSLATADLNNYGALDKAALSDLDLILQMEISPGTWQDVYMSGYTGSTVDQIYIPALSGTADYRLDVRAGNLADASTHGEQYALAVSFTTVPEPGTVGILLIGMAGLLMVCRRR